MIARVLAEWPLIVYVCGLGLLTYGVWGFSHAAGLIVGGALLAGSAFLYARNEREREHAEEGLLG